MIVDPAAHTDPVDVTPPGASELAWAADYAFRTQQSAPPPKPSRP